MWKILSNILVLLDGQVFPRCPIDSADTFKVWENVPMW